MKNKLQYDGLLGRLSYYIDGEEIYDLKEVQINGNKYKVVRVDDSEVSYGVWATTKSSTKKYQVRVPFEGIVVLVDLIEIVQKKIVVATKFSKEKPKATPRRRWVK